MHTGDSHHSNHQLKSLFDLLYLRLCRFADQIITDSAAAEDIVQEAFIKYWQRHADITDLPAIKTLLYVMVRNACLNHLKHQKVVEKFAQTQTEVAEEAAVLKAEVWGELYRAIASLPEGCRNVFKLSYLEGLKNQEIADELKISINTVKTQKARALELLKLRLKPEAFLVLCLLVSEKYF